jgi:C-terminal processing protease CtpA/Prc
MNKKTAIAIAACIAILMVTGVLLFVFQPPKQVSHRPPPRITDDAPKITEFVGVGLQLRNDAGGHAVVIDHVMPATPAAEAHISGGMIVSKVDDVSLEGKLLADCVNLIRGPVGSRMRLELVTPDHSQTNTVELTRRKITL